MRTDLFFKALTSLSPIWSDVIDQEFYPVDVLTENERQFLSAGTVTDGAVIVVCPTDQSDGVSFDRVSLDHPKARALAHMVAPGMGASDLGAASLARVMADHYRTPVGAIASGLGVGELTLEFAQGLLAAWQRRYWPVQAQIPWAAFNWTMLEAFRLDDAYAFWLRRSLPEGDGASTLLKLLMSLDSFPELRSLTGHAKGALTMAAALEVLAATARSADLDRVADLRIRTLGSVIMVPECVHDVIQYLGSVDDLGQHQSAPGVLHEPLRGLGHSLNPSRPQAIDLTALLAREPG